MTHSEPMPSGESPFRARNFDEDDESAPLTTRLEHVMISPRTSRLSTTDDTGGITTSCTSSCTNSGDDGEKENSENGDKMMKIKLKTMTGKILEVDVDAAATVAAVKDAVETLEGVPTSFQQLSLGGRGLLCDEALSSLDLSGGAMLDLTLRQDKASSGDGADGDTSSLLTSTGVVQGLPSDPGMNPSLRPPGLAAAGMWSTVASSSFCVKFTRVSLFFAFGVPMRDACRLTYQPHSLSHISSSLR